MVDEVVGDVVGADDDEITEELVGDDVLVTVVFVGVNGIGVDVDNGKGVVDVTIVGNDKVEDDTVDGEVEEVCDVDEVVGKGKGDVGEG